MTQTLGLGLLGTATQWYLPGTDTALLPLPLADAPPLLHAITETNFSDPPPEGLLFGGLVQASRSTAGLLVDVLGAWNSVKNAVILSDAADRVTLSGFVHADVTLGGGGDSFVALIGAKRGNVITGAGDDVITIQVADNALGWVGTFRVTTGEGDDIVTVGALDIAAQVAAGDATFAATAHGAGGFTGRDAGTQTIIDLGAGDDRFVGLGESRDQVFGGDGQDIIAAGRGDDVLTGGADADIFRFAAGDGADQVLDFTPGEDRLQFVGLSVPDLEAMLDAALAQDGGLLLAYGADSVFLAGIAPGALSLSDLI
ncbi:calcium-binding protein [Roseomonas terrae]|jgi:Ca2+-binding RTX toxin-like protein|uniref:Calcium-binding protein n=1 Tax=Neoroseomonas terrae TaxID=424799 RepID=A0ABS5EQX2_9PROT|nr:hypothetical protein [Neoroseomonas terrae]MBR0653423.1 calcium-binding protein [Neoroseomonas terrae]